MQTLLLWMCICSTLVLQSCCFRLKRADGTPCGLFGADAEVSCGATEVCVPPNSCPGAAECLWKCFQDICPVDAAPAFHQDSTLWCDCPAGTFGSLCGLTSAPSCVTDCGNDGTAFCDDTDACTCADFYTDSDATDGCTTGPATCAPACSGIDESCYETAPATFTCACDPGYEYSGGVCVDTDECSGSPSPCHVYAMCNNTVGSYTCVCLEGYIGNGEICVDNVCDSCDPAGYEECDEDLNMCVCESGFTREDLCEPCEDIDECQSDPCPEGADCENFPSGFVCECSMPGWIPGGETGCEDINECELDLDDCHYKAICVDVGGPHWFCECPEGYTGDGHVCYDIEECDDTDDCDEHAHCTDAFGDYICECDEGWVGVGTECEDAIECGFYDDCDPHANCIDCSGWYYCECWDGWHGSGIVGDCHQHGSGSSGHGSGSHGHESGSHGHDSGSHGHDSGSDGHDSGSHDHDSGSHGHGRDSGSHGHHGGSHGDDSSSHEGHEGSSSY